MPNVNVGVLGHVDSGKTSFCRVVTQIKSTAALDKNPQSKERGITLDLGLSSFSLPPDLQVTLVDCPGHAGLIRAVLGAAQIIDLCLLIVDATKGFQTQTAECVVLAEVACDKLIVVLNKVDLFDASVREAEVAKMVTKIQKTLAATKFGIVEVVAISTVTSEGIPKLLDCLSLALNSPVRLGVKDKFQLLYDHCFQVKGQGTVLTGTVIAGAVKVGDMVDVAGFGAKKVKGLQVFKQPVLHAIQGDRVGVCVTGLDPDGVERGLMTMASDPAPSLEYIVCSCESIRYFKLDINSKAKFHVTIGHSTVMAVAMFFKGDRSFSLDTQYSYSEGIVGSDLVLLKLETPVLYPPGCLYLASKLDLDIHSPGCRLAFNGKVLRALSEADVQKLCIIKTKEKCGTVERNDGSGKYIVKGLLKKDSDISKLIGQRVKHVSGAQGMIDGPFGKSGRVRVSFDTIPENIKIDENVTLQLVKRVSIKLYKKLRHENPLENAQLHAQQPCRMRFRI